MGYPNQCLTDAYAFRYGMCCFALCVGLLTAPGVSADESNDVLLELEEDILEAAAPEGSEAEENSSASHFYWFVVVISMGLGGFGIYRVNRRRRAPRYFHFEAVHHDDELLLDRLNGENALGVPRSIIRKDEPVAAPPAGPFDDFFKHPDAAVNRANFEDLARTGAHFHGAQDLEDPVQSSFGASLKQRRALSEQARFAEFYGLNRLVCSGCDRRYSMEAQFCYHDGLPLMQDTAQLAQISASFQVCKNCGWESDLGEEHPKTCSAGEATWTTIDVAKSASILPMIPMMICPHCGLLGAPGQVHCPVDLEFMSPLLDIHNPELPLRGFGPRRKVCSTCGEAHGPAARYCSEDGSELVTLN